MEIYTQLCSAGNTLFLDWKAEFLCNASPDTKYTVCMDFGVGDECKLYGTRPLKDELPCLIEFMEKCLTRWNGHVEEKRMKYYHLNYFTTKQLRLCRDLAGNGNQEHDAREKFKKSSQVHALLSYLSPFSQWESMKISLVSSMESATQDIIESQCQKVQQIPTSRQRRNNNVICLPHELRKTTC